MAILEVLSTNPIRPNSPAMLTFAVSLTVSEIWQISVENSGDSRGIN